MTTQPTTAETPDWGYLPLAGDSPRTPSSGVSHGGSERCAVAWLTFLGLAAYNTQSVYFLRSSGSR